VPESASKEQFIQKNFQIGVAEAMAKLKTRKDGQFFLETLEHGSMSVEIYQPQKIDLQQPHKQDELYVVYSGSGTFYNDGVRHPFKTGDVLFAPAGAEHRFEDFTEDFITWVIFYGPQGGEAQKPAHQTFIAEKDDYQISANDARLDTDYVFSYLSKESYWSKNIPKAIFEKSLQNSLNFGLYHQEQQIGFARVITDRSTFAYLADVFVEEGFRGQGLALWLTETIKAQEDLQYVKRWMLMTHSAQDLYKKAGFQIAAHPERVMEIAKPNPYGRA
ncbi:MAG: GNAT family N-acetyltransferase, partial [Chitinophagales bacterium]